MQHGTGRSRNAHLYLHRDSQGATFTNQFDLDTPLPSILVSSDLDTAVPEPASLVLLGASLAGLGLVRRKV